MVSVTNLKKKQASHFQPTTGDSAGKNDDKMTTSRTCQLSLANANANVKPHKLAETSVSSRLFIAPCEIDPIKSSEMGFLICTWSLPT